MPTSILCFLVSFSNLSLCKFSGLCEGDCDNDEECDIDAGLICFKRDDFDPVPGCSGGGESDKDYCYDPNAAPNPIGPSEVPTRKPTYSPTVSNAPSTLNKVYEYYVDTTKCDGDLKNNDQGPEPGEDDTVLKFWAYGTCFYVFLS